MQWRLLTVLLMFTFLHGCGGGSWNSSSSKIFTGFVQVDASKSFVEEPLSIPPGIGQDISLRPRADVSSQYLAPEAVVFQMIFDKSWSNYNSETNKVALDKADMIVLRQAGANNSFPNIRREINEQTLGITKIDQNFVHRLLHWKVDESL